MKVIEITVTFFLLMGPLSSPYFHLHHWFAVSLFGMHFNFDVWWSRAVVAGAGDVISMELPCTDAIPS
jgi:hypothetical protein